MTVYTKILTPSLTDEKQLAAVDRTT